MHIRSRSIGPRVKGGARSPALPRAVPAAPHSRAGSDRVQLCGESSYPLPRRERCAFRVSAPQPPRSPLTPALGVIASSFAMSAVTHSRPEGAAHLAHPCRSRPQSVYSRAGSDCVRSSGANSCPLPYRRRCPGPSHSHRDPWCTSRTGAESDTAVRLLPVRE